MENQTPVAPIVTPPVVVEQPKQPNFLTILLSILLILSVLIAGFFAFQTQKLVKELTLLRSEPTPTVTVEPVATNSATSDPTIDWKTYTDNKLNFSFKYPEDLTIRMLENGVAQFLDTQDKFVFSFNGIQNLTRTEFLNYKFIDPKEFIDNTNRKWKTHLIYAEVYNYEVFFDNSNKITQVAFQGKTVTIESLANQILSTFKFTN